MLPLECNSLFLCVKGNDLGVVIYLCTRMGIVNVFLQHCKSYLVCLRNFDIAPKEETYFLFTKDTFVQHPSRYEILDSGGNNKRDIIP